MICHKHSTRTHVNEWENSNLLLSFNNIFTFSEIQMWNKNRLFWASNFIILANEFIFSNMKIIINFLHLEIILFDHLIDVTKFCLIYLSKCGLKFFFKENWKHEFIILKEVHKFLLWTNFSGFIAYHLISFYVIYCKMKRIFLLILNSSINNSNHFLSFNGKNFFRTVVSFVISHVSFLMWKMNVHVSEFILRLIQMDTFS